MRPTGSLLDAFPVQMTESGISIGLEDAGEVLQVLVRALAAAIGRVTKQHRGWIVTCRRPIIAHIGP